MASLPGHLRLRVMAIAGAALALGLACSDTTGVADPPRERERVPSDLSLSPSMLTLNDGGTDTLSVTVFDQNGEAFASVPGDVDIEWSADAPDIVSINDGVISANHPGETQVTARSGAMSASAMVKVLQVPTKLVAVYGDGQAATAGGPVPDRIGVRLHDRHGDGVPGVLVTFRPADGGSATPATMTTNAAGLAETTWTLGPGNGPQELEAVAAAGVPGLSFTATATADSPATVINVGSENLSAVAGSRLITPLVVEVRDQFGNPVPEVAVSWAVSSGGGAISPAAAATGEDGRASAIWTLGGTAGAQEATAVVAGLEVVTFSALATVGDPASLIEVSGGGQSAVAGGTLVSPLVVEVRDAQGNPVPGVDVAWTVASGGGSISPASAATGADGRTSATWTLGDGAGSQEVSAKASGVADPVTFTASASSASVATVEVSPSAAALEVGETLQLNATAKDAAGNVLQGHEITWTSSEATRADVSQDGLVTAIAPASGVMITAAIEGKQGSAEITVVEVPVASIEVTPGAATLTVGQSLQLEAIVKDASGDELRDRIVTWHSDNTAVVSISPAGLVTGEGAGGPTRIVATSEGVADTALIEVELQPDTIYFAPNQVTLPVDDTVWIDIFVLDQEGNAMDMRGRGDLELYREGNVEIVDVVWETPSAGGRSGRVRVRGHALGYGAVTLFIAEYDARASVTFFVSEPIEFRSVRLLLDDGSPAGTALSLPAGQTVRLGLEAITENGPGQYTASWESSDEEVFSVQEQGPTSAVLSGSRIGKALLRVTVKGLDGINSETVELEVTVTAGPLSRISFEPDFVDLVAGQEMEVDIIAQDEAGNVLDMRDRPLAIEDLGCPEDAQSCGGSIELELIAWVDPQVPATRARSGRGRVRGIAQGSGAGEYRIDGFIARMEWFVQEGVTSVWVEPWQATLSQGETLQFDVDTDLGRPADYDWPVVWRSSDSTIASISGAGLLTAEAPGTVTITATVFGVEGDATVTVDQQASLLIEPAGLTFAEPVPRRRIDVRWSDMTPGDLSLSTTSR